MPAPPDAWPWRRASRECAAPGQARRPAERWIGDGEALADEVASVQIHDWFGITRLPALRESGFGSRLTPQERLVPLADVGPERVVHLVEASDRRLVAESAVVAGCVPVEPAGERGRAFGA